MLTDSDLDRYEATQAAAHDHLLALCKGEATFRMCIPVQDSDSDVVLVNALFQGRQTISDLRKANTMLTAAMDIIKAYWKLHKDANDEFDGMPGGCQCPVCDRALAAKRDWEALTESEGEPS